MMSFLAPWMMAGAALLTIPWLLHHIRKPERQPLLFSSLMFVPDIKKDVIERRTIQHILLMLLRMLVLLLLAFTFARPAWEALASRDALAGQTWHAILLDTSYSMGLGDNWQIAKKRVAEILGRLKPDERVAVIGFNRRPTVYAPLAGSELDRAGDPAFAAAALDRIQLSPLDTDYGSALRLAHNELTQYEPEDEQTKVRRIIHVISDFQKTGLPAGEIDWKLSSEVELECIDIGKTSLVNYAITDLTVRTDKSGDCKLRVKIKNFSTESESPRLVSLWLGDERVQQQTVQIKPGFSTTVSFLFTPVKEKTALGRVELDDDDLAMDNLRYFVWNPPRKTDVLLLAGSSLDRPLSAAWYLHTALVSHPDTPWRIDAIEPDRLDRLADPSQPPPIVVMTSALETDPAPLLQSLSAGAAVFMIGSPAMVESEPTRRFLAELGIAELAASEPSVSKSRFHTWSWIDFDHPVFLPFQGAQYNDFTHLHFYRTFRVSLSEPAGLPVRWSPVVRFDADSHSEQPPAILDGMLDQGRIALWLFSLEPDLSNIVKSKKFIPLLYETLWHLGGKQEFEGERLVGDPLILPDAVAAGSWSVRFPGESDFVPVDSDRVSSDSAWPRQAGWIEWKPDRTGEPAIVEAVNVPSIESDLTRITVDEFRLKFGASAVLPIPAEIEGSRLHADVTREKSESFFYEYGMYGFLIVCLLLGIESLYSLSIARREADG